MNKKLNTRILIIDDDENIRDSFRNILLPRTETDEGLNTASARLFDEEVQTRPKENKAFEFFLDEACNGSEGLQFVEKAIEEKSPYAVIFVDMRMPGWDGLETVQHIRKIDPRAEIIFVTAFSDHSIDKIIQEAGSNVGYHCKPFEVEEIRQLATKSIYEWNKARNLEALISSISSLKTSQWHADVLLNNILLQLCEMLGTNSAMLLIRAKEGFQKVLATGKLTSEELSNSLVASLPLSNDSEESIHHDYAYFKLEKYGVVVLFEKGHDQLRQEHIYLVKLFLEHAGQTLVNAELHEEIVRKESLSAIGQAVSMISHDMRNIVGSIISCSDLLGDGVGEEESRDLLSLIKSSAREGLLLVEDVLDFVRGAQPNLSDNESTAFMEKVETKVDYLRECYSKIEITCITPEAFTFTCDTTKMVCVIDNLIRNAVEALYTTGSESGRVDIRLLCENEKTVFTVTDNGPGIPEEIAKDLFIPFKTYGKAKGTGLGLAIVKQFVESHDGTITHESSPGQTVFKVVI